MQARDDCANSLDLLLFAIEKRHFAADGRPRFQGERNAVISVMSRRQNGLIAFGYTK
jgi:hypothetical protein